jgi:hypothetical protein
MYQPITQPSGSGLSLRMDKGDYTILGVGEGSACSSFFLGIPLGGENTYKKAVEKAVSSKGGDLLIQASADETLTYFPATFLSIYQQRCITVTGLVVRLK